MAAMSPPAPGRNPLLSTGAPGIDVSHYRPIKSFAALAKSSVRVIGVKATEGGSLWDSRLLYHKTGIRNMLGLNDALVIYYHFARSGDPKQQAKFFLNTVGDLRPNERVALDLEVLPAAPADTLNWVTAWYQAQWELRGVKDPKLSGDFIYTSKRIWSMFGNPDWSYSNLVSLWAPRYNSERTPELPKPWESTGFRLWQWSDGDIPDGPVEWPGVGSCDLNVWNGTSSDLKEWMGQPAYTSNLLAHVFSREPRWMSDEDLARVKGVIDALHSDRAALKKA